MKRAVVLFISTLWALCVVAQGGKKVEYVKTKIGDQIQFEIPSTFENIPEEALVTKYGFYRFPMASYMDDGGDVTFFANKTAFMWNGETDLNVLKETYKATISHYFYKVEFLTDTIITKKKKQYIVLEYIGQTGKDGGSLNIGDTTMHNKYNDFKAMNRKVYSYRVYTVAKDKGAEEENVNNDKDDSKEIQNERETQKIERLKTKQGSVLPDQKQQSLVNKLNSDEKKDPSMFKKQKVYIFDFACPIRLKEKWEGVAKEIIDSIQVK